MDQSSVNQSATHDDAEQSWRGRLSLKFLLWTLPIIVCGAALYCAALMHFERQQIIRANQSMALDWAKNDAFLLTDPLWHLDEKGVRTVLEAQIQRPHLDCIRLHQFSSVLPSDLAVGHCKASDPYAIETPVMRRAKGESILIGELQHSVIIQPTFEELFAALKPLLLMLVLLVVLLVVTVIIVFRSLILLPLSRVSDSINGFRRDGRRDLAEWHSHDELGVLIREYNQGLLKQEQIEAELHDSVNQTRTALNELQIAQKNLLEAEKLASLGSLVAGIAHEINTPVGNSLTVASAIAAKLDGFRAELNAGQLKKSTLHGFLEQLDEAAQILQRSLNAAALQIQSFKQVAVDQTSSQRRSFDLQETLLEVLSTLKPALKSRPIQVSCDVTPGILLDSYPGPLGQVVTNAFTNALLHAFEPDEQGSIRLCAEVLGDRQVQIRLVDNGRGMSGDVLKRVFEPFFTTRLGSGGSGLGMNLAYNIVTSVLGGEIHVESELGVGTSVAIRIPLIAPKQPRSLE